jgi:tetratricopeptide (TPR) repeat protein
VELDTELALYNKIGDLYLKINDTIKAVETYERGVSRYADSGFPNNAIALCNKILRIAPARTPVYLKLAKLMLDRGFVAEAKQNLLEYAERMQRSGQTDEAFHALREFADLSPHNEEIRLLLAEQLKLAARTEEARAELAKLYAVVEASGDARRTRSTLHKLKAIDPDFDAEKVPRPKVVHKKEKTSELVFLDLDEPAGGVAVEEVEAEPAPRGRTAPPPVEEPAVPLIETVERQAEAEALEEENVSGGLVIEPTSLGEPEPVLPDTLLSLDIEHTAHIAEEEPAEIEAPSILDEPDESLPLPSAAEIQIERASAEYLQITDDELEAAKTEEGLTELEPTAFEGPGAARPSGYAAPVVEPEAGEGDVAELPLVELGLEEASAAGRGEADLEVAELDLAELDEGVAAAESGVAEMVELPELDVGAPEIDLAGDVVVAVPPLEELEARAAAAPADAAARRSLAEARIEAGDRDGGLRELDQAIALYEAQNDFAHAEDVANEILRLDPNSVRHHQKLVEFAFRKADKRTLAEAYLGLADALFRTGNTERARAVYQRVLEHDPDSERARLGLATLEPAHPPAQPARPSGPRLAPSPKEFVDLGALILDETPVTKDTRMRIEEEEPTGDEERDFKEMLTQFKRGIEANVAEEDWEAHYDLGVAFKEMGLLDEAIAEFQKALRSSESRLKTAEALGLCFYEKGQYSVAATVLRRAVESERGGDEAKIGLLYWLARCEEEQGKTADALAHYQRVFALDIAFQDVGKRVKSLGHGA